MNKRTIESFGLAVPILTALALFGIVKAVFGFDTSSGLIGSGISLNVILGLANVVLAYLIYKRYI